MIKFKTSNKNGERQLIGLGLSDGNIKLLRQHKPILINGQELGLDQDIVILWAKTEMELLNQVRQWFVEDFEKE